MKVFQLLQLLKMTEKHITRLSEQDLIDAAAFYLDEYHNFDPIELSIELLLEEKKGISAVIDKKE